MGKLIYFAIFMTSVNPTYENASDQARRAFLETEMAKIEMRQLEDDAERHLKDWTGLDRNDLVYGAYLYPIVAGRVSSKPFKNFKYESKNHWVVRPEIEYVFSSKETSTVLVLIKEF